MIYNNCTLTSNVRILINKWILEFQCQQVVTNYIEDSIDVENGCDETESESPTFNIVTFNLPYLLTCVT